MAARNGTETIQLAAIADIHYGKSSQGSLQSLFAAINERADVLLLCGDLTNYGQPEEAQALLNDLHATVRIPMVAVLGNHDYESGRQDELYQMFCDAGISVLDGDTVEIGGVGFAGVKGFAGGFGRGALGYWGEPAIKAFVQEAINESLKLEKALARLSTQHQIVLLHYAPIRETVEGEPPVIFPYLGSSRLEEPLNRYPVTAVFHGHAHHGSYKGATTSGVPVYNVSLGILKQEFEGSDEPPVHIMELTTVPSADSVPVIH